MTFEVIDTRLNVSIGLIQAEEVRRTPNWVVFVHDNGSNSYVPASRYAAKNLDDWLTMLDLGVQT